MIVLLMRTNDDAKTLSKTAVTLATVNAIPYEQFNVLHPRLILEWNAELKSANYCFIPDFGKYYFLSMTLDKGKQMILNCDVDPLKSWDVAIRGLTGTILRSESVGKPTAIKDDKLPIDPNTIDVKSILFDNKLNINPFSSWCWVLNVLGGAMSGD